MKLYAGGSKTRKEFRQMITIEQLNAIRKEMAPKLAMRHGHAVPPPLPLRYATHS